MRYLVLVCLGVVLLSTNCRVDFDAVDESVNEARRGLSTHEWREGSNSLKVSIKGNITLAGQENDVETLEPDGFLKIDQRGEEHWTFEAIAQPDGSIQRKFTRNGNPLPAGAQTTQWLGGILPEIMRRTGIDAAARIRRIHAARGAEAVVGEIEEIKSGSVQRIYVEEFLSDHRPSVEHARRLARVAVAIESSTEAERIIEQLVGQHPEDSELTEHLVEASAQIRSSRGKVRVTDSILANRKIGEKAALKVAESLAEIRSSSEKANGLVILAEAAPRFPSVQLALLDTAETIRSSSEMGRALRAVVQNAQLDQTTAIRAAEVIESIRSRSERASVLRQLVSDMPLDPEVLQSVLKAARSLSSSSKEQVVTVLLRRDYPRSELESILQFVRDTFPEGSIISTRLKDRIERKLDDSK